MDIKSALVLILIVISYLATNDAVQYGANGAYRFYNPLEKEVTKEKKNFLSREQGDVSRLTILITTLGIMVKELKNPPEYVKIIVTNGGIKDPEIVKEYFWAGMGPKNILKVMKDNSRINVEFKRDKKVDELRIEINACHTWSSLNIVAQQGSTAQIAELVQVNSCVVTNMKLERKMIIGLFKSPYLDYLQSRKIVSEVIAQIAHSDIERDAILEGDDGKRKGFIIKMGRNPGMNLTQVLAQLGEIEKIDDDF